MQILTPGHEFTGTVASISTELIGTSKKGHYATTTPDLAHTHEKPKISKTIHLYL
jgi:hypothetical protein